jgi:hypothetical protein
VARISIEEKRTSLGHLGRSITAGRRSRCRPQSRIFPRILGYWLVRSRIGLSFLVAAVDTVAKHKTVRIG